MSTHHKSELLHRRLGIRDPLECIVILPKIIIHPLPLQLPLVQHDGDILRAGEEDGPRDHYVPQHDVCARVPCQVVSGNACVGRYNGVSGMVVLVVSQVNLRKWWCCVG